MSKLEELEGECKLNIGDELNSFGRRCYEMGIREVVEWVKLHSDLERCDPDVMAYFTDYRLFDEDEWQAKLKEWGIDV